MSVTQSSPSRLEIVPSPCIRYCKLDHAQNHCLGCLRTVDELTQWARMSDQRKRQVWADLPNRALAGWERSGPTRDFASLAALVQDSETSP